MPSFGSPISLRGPQGLAGADGLSPTTSYGPRTDSAAEGQVNFDLTNFQVQVYSSGAWTASRSFAGTQGIQGEVGFFGYGNAAPDSTTYAGDANGFYLRTNGQVYFYSKANGWQDSGESLLGPAGAAGRRGSVLFEGNGPPPSDASTLMVGDVTGALPGDTYRDVQTAGGPYEYYYS